MLRAGKKTDKKIWIIFMALAVAILAPFKALTTPVNAQAEESCTIVKACCAVMRHCCCEPSPRPPADLDTAAVLPVQPKFVAIKGTGNVVNHFLSRFSQAPIVSCEIQASSRSDIVSSRPLYILKRALLI